MGLVLVFILLFGFGLSIVAMVTTTGYQRKLAKDNRESSWPVFLMITLLLTVVIGWLGAGVWPESQGAGTPTGHNYEMVALSTLIFGLAPGFGVILANVYSRTR